MTWLTAGLVTGILSAIGGFGLWLWSVAEKRGEIKGRNDELEAEIARQKKTTETMAAPARSYADIRRSLRERKPKD